MAETSMNLYEVTFVAKPTLGDDGVAALTERLAQVIAGQSGEVQSVEPWGKRTLAYPIKRFFEGVYVLNYVNLPPQGIAEVDRFLRFNEDVLRHLIVRSGE